MGGGLIDYLICKRWEGGRKLTSDMGRQGLEQDKKVMRLAREAPHWNFQRVTLHVGARWKLVVERRVSVLIAVNKMSCRK